jgi:hypothetical protein
MATQLIYRAIQTPIVFKESGGDAVITLLNLAFGVGRISAQYDRGAGSKPVTYKWKAVMQFETAAIVGERVELYVAESNGTSIDGGVGAADAALAAAAKPNLKMIGIVTVQTTDTATSFIASGLCTIWERYFSLGVWNASAGDNLENTANASFVSFTPMPDEIQAAT